MQPQRSSIAAEDESDDVPTGVASSDAVLLLAFPLQVDDREKGNRKNPVEDMLPGRR